MTAESAKTATYVYCAVKSDAAPKPSKKAKGLPKAKAPRALEVGDGWWLVVADAPLGEYGAEAVEASLRDFEWIAARAAAHNAVVEGMLDEAATVLPMKMFTLFSTDARAVDDARKNAKKMGRAAARVEDADEWGLRILLDEARAVKMATEANARGVKPSSGRGFLERKAAQQDVRRKLVVEARREVAELFEALERIARKAIRRPAPAQELEGRVLLDGTFLVPRDAAKKFRAAVAKTAERLADEGYHVSLTGPWPAYSFLAGALA